MCRADRHSNLAPAPSGRSFPNVNVGSGQYKIGACFFMSSSAKVLILSVGYGQGHHAAAAAIAEEYTARGMQVRVEDLCATAHPRVFGLTQAYYNLCVRRAPWLWGITYAQTDTADWSDKARAPFIYGVTHALAKLLREWKPDLIICTYPLYAHLLDYLQQRLEKSIPCVVMVTDAIEISRPWLVTHASLICVPDEYSYEMARMRYGLPSSRLACTGFPVSRSFLQQEGNRAVPSPESLRILYAAYTSPAEVYRQVRALVEAFPRVSITLLAFAHYRRLKQKLQPEIESGNVHIMERSDNMNELMASHHFYVGKAGAATVFEAYATGIPVLINFALPGQEQGNLELLRNDAVGHWVSNAGELVSIIHRMLQHNAAGWLRSSSVMLKKQRACGASRLADITQSLFHV